MKLAILATLVFLAGLWPGLAKSTGPLPDAPRPPQTAAAAPVHLAHPVLVKMAGVLKLRM
jgi:hypothetical protein